MVYDLAIDMAELMALRKAEEWAAKLVGQMAKLYAMNLATGLVLTKALSMALR